MINSFSVESRHQPGTYYVGAIADYNNSRAESNETNNALADNTITVQ